MFDKDFERIHKLVMDATSDMIDSVEGMYEKGKKAWDERDLRIPRGAYKMPPMPVFAMTDKPMQNVIKTEDGVLVELCLPGCKKEDVSLKHKDGLLTIEAKSESLDEKKDEDGNVIMRQFRSGSFKKQFNIEGFDETKISAKFEDGILRIKLVAIAEPVDDSTHIDIE